jgi:hypothetical protein
MQEAFSKIKALLKKAAVTHEEVPAGSLAPTTNRGSILVSAAVTGSRHASKNQA